MSACPSRLELSRWEAEPEHTRPADLVEHVGTCVRCSAIFADIESARSLLLGADPAEASERAARAILEASRERRSRKNWLRFLVPVFLVPAVAALLFVAKASLGPVTKGELIVETYVKRGEKVRPAVDGQEFLEGDRLRFAYTSGRAGYLLVFGVEDNGKIFPYYHDVALEGMYAEAGARIMLPGSVELDAHKGWERIFAIFSERQLPDDIVRRSVVSGLTAAGNDIRRLTALDLPVEQVSLLLRRP